MDQDLFKYKDEDFLGEGGFGKVYRGKYHKTGKDVAIKVIKDYQSDARQEREIRNLSNLSGENIVCFIDFIVIANNAYLIMELCNGDVQTYVSKIGRKFTDLEIKDFIRQTTTGLKVIHDNKMVHRDIKPANILFLRKGSQIIYKLSDFGLSKMISRTTNMTWCGTPVFMAPELLLGKVANLSADIWSLGKTFCFMITRNIRDLEFENKTEGNLKDLISKILQENFRERITVDQILSHPFLRN